MQYIEGMKLPPLNALKAFEAAARTGSFVTAAGQLGVSSAAVSMQVRNLENFLNKKLFTRSNNRITLTDAGKSIYPGTASALSSIATITERILESETRPQLIISTLPSLSERWLVPRLAAFAEAQHSVGMEVRIEDDPVDFARHNIDIRITYGDHLYPEFRSTQLFQDALTPMLAPDPQCRFGTEDSVSQIADEHLVHVEWGEHYASQPSWRDWFHAVGIERQVDISKGFKVASPSLAIALATRGLGVALCQKALAKSELASGTLISLSRRTIKLAYPYCAITPHAKSGDRHLEQLLKTIRER